MVKIIFVGIFIWCQTAVSVPIHEGKIKNNRNKPFTFESFINDISFQLAWYYIEPFANILGKAYLNEIFVGGPKRTCVVAEQYFAKSFQYDEFTGQYRFNGAISNTTTAYPNAAAFSPNKKYLLVIRGIAEKSSNGSPLHFYYIQIYRKTASQRYRLDFTSKYRWRIYDFKTFLWEEDKIKAIGSDVGTSYFKLNANKWIIEH